MTILRNRFGNREIMRSERLHKSKLLHRRQARHVHPRCGNAVAEVISVRLHGAEGYPTQSVDLQYALRTRGVCDDDDVGFLPYADSVPNGVYALVLLVRVQREIVEAAVGQSVPVI